MLSALVLSFPLFSCHQGVFWSTGHRLLPTPLLMERFSGIIQAVVCLAIFAAMIAVVGLDHQGISSGRFDSAHEKADCNKCHTFVASTGSSARPVNRSEQCLTCHSSSPGSNELAFHGGNQDCLECHNYHRTGTILAVDREFHFDFSSDRLTQQCRSCHTGSSRPTNLSPGHQAAVSVYHSDSFQLSGLSPSQGCMLCHSTGSQLTAPSTGKLTAPKFSQHASHPVGLTVVPGAGRGKNKIRQEIDPRIELFDGRIECQTCHSMTSGSQYLMADFESATAMCQGCHEHGTR